jgi:hypothetical protein
MTRGGATSTDESRTDDQEDQFVQGGSDLAGVGEQGEVVARAFIGRGRCSGRGRRPRGRRTSDLCGCARGRRDWAGIQFC